MPKAFVFTAHGNPEAEPFTSRPRTVIPRPSRSPAGRAWYPALGNC